MNHLSHKVAALEQVYAIYRSSTAGQDIACAARCSQCCTTDLTLTTLEAYHLCEHMDRIEKEQLRRRLEAAADSDRFQPLLTTNQLADICAAGKEPPTEERSAAAARCPLLVEELCRRYDTRPFHCRCMVSRRACSETGSAEIDEYTLTLSTVFLQVIEHLDRPGCTGNLLDVLPRILTAEFKNGYVNGVCDCASAGLAANRPLTKLMIPPEHRDRLRPVIGKLQSIQLRPI